MGVALRTFAPLGCTRGLKVFRARKTVVNAPKSGASGAGLRLKLGRERRGTCGISPSEVTPLATEYVEKGLNGEGEMEDSVTDCVINTERGMAGRKEKD